MRTVLLIGVFLLTELQAVNTEAIPNVTKSSDVVIDGASSTTNKTDINTTNIPCSVCPNGLSVNETESLGSKTCADLLIDARNVTESSEECKSMLLAQHTCCPKDAPTYAPTVPDKLENYRNPHNMTMDELDMHLYVWEEEAVAVNEYYDNRVMHNMRTGEYDDDWQDSGDGGEEEEEKKGGWLSRLKETATHEDTGSRTKVEFKKGPTKYLNLTDNAAHVVEFYAPWCPHCQHYKWEYVEIAEEVKRRSVTPVQFHAVSCDLYYAMCATYKIAGFPTILGWKMGESKGHRGLELNEEEDIEPDTVAEMLGLDLAHENIELFDWEFEDNETEALVMEKLAEKGRKAARIKKSWHEHEPHTHNDRYHNAALSLAFAVKSQLFQTLTEDGKIEPKRKDALIDFLNLLEWATPQSWKLRTSFVKEMQWKINDAIQVRGDIETLITNDQNSHRAEATEDLWGYVDASEGGGWAGKMFGKSQEELAKEDKHWSKTCTHMEPGKSALVLFYPKGFTCGLWNLFHILTIGSSKQEHELYGFHRGYFVSPHHVAETIRNFIAYFFSCDVCRTNFLNMYDSCGHDHCKRLKSEIAIGPIDGSDDPSRMELALWLWEVHNSVNARLMKEAAARQNREVSHEEILASKFPTLKLCPDCWLDANMTKYDNATVFRFLDEWYWPTHEPSNAQFKSVIAGTTEEERELVVDETTASSDKPVVKSSTIQSSFGFGFASVLCLVAFSLLAVAAAQKKRREKRKKFVDSRFVKKKKQSSSCLPC